MRYPLNILSGDSTIKFGRWWLPKVICTFDSEVKPGVNYFARIKAVKRLVNRQSFGREVITDYRWVMDGHSNEDSTGKVTKIIFTNIREEP